MKLASELHSIMAMETFAINDVCMNGSRCMVNEPLITFGRIHEPKRTDASGAWYKRCKWISSDNYDHYFANDLLGERIPITEQQYNDDKLKNTTNNKLNIE